jgi:hypothetical protein
MGTAGTATHGEPWNQGKIVGQKAPFKLKDIWALRVRLQMEGRVRELALFNQVTLHHGGWGTGAEWDQAYAYFTKAWPSVLKNLQKSFVDGPYDWTARMEQLRKMQEKK